MQRSVRNQGSCLLSDLELRESLAATRVGFAKLPLLKKVSPYGFPAAQIIRIHICSLFLEINEILYNKHTNRLINYDNDMRVAPYKRFCEQMS